MKTTKQVRIVCDGCGDDSGTVEFIERISRALNVSTDVVHERLWDGEIKLMGCHAEHVASPE